MSKLRVSCYFVRGTTEKRRAMRATKSRTISYFAAAGAAFAVSAIIGAPSAGADPETIDCQAGQIVIAGQCAVPAPTNKVPPPQNGTSPGMGSGDSAGHGY
jgi:hypothetical protein